MRRATMVSAGGVALAGPASAQDVAAAKARQLAAGVQIVPKGSQSSGLDPMLAYLPDLSTVDIAGSRRARAAEQAALLLLDVLSGPTGRTSLNTYLTPASDKITFVAQGVGNVAAHEVGHFIGSWHVDQFNEVAGLMDQGGNPALDVRHRPGQDRRHGR